MAELAQRAKGYTLRTGVYVNTTDATQTTAARFTTKSDRGYLAVAHVIAQETADHDETASYIVAGTFQNDGGTLTLVSTVTTIHEKETTAGWGVTLDAATEDNDGDLTSDNKNIRVRVTGASSTAVTWLASLDIYEVNTYLPNYGPIA